MNSSPLKTLFLLLTLIGACQAGQESLLIGAGDEIHVQVFDTPEMDQHVRVTDVGEIPLMFIGNLKIAGMTPGEAAHAIEAELIGRKYMLHPQVEVTVEEYATERVAVMGQVKSPGAFEIKAPTPLITMLSLAGGLTDLADRHVVIERHGNSQDTVKYFLSNKPVEAIANDPVVYPGDTVLIPKVGLIYVLGDVGRPGGFPMSNNDSQITVLQAIALAGATNKTAILSRVKLIRTGKGGPIDIPIKLTDMQQGKMPDLTMQPNDILYIPSSWIKGLAANSTAIAASATSAIIYAHP